MFEQILNMFEGLGFFKPFAFIPIYIIGTVLFVPTAVHSVGAGILFGVPMGIFLVSISPLISEGGFFLAGRYLSRAWVLKKVATNKKTQALYDAVAEGGWKMVVLIRLSAVLPFSLVNYALGLSKIRFSHYLAASWIGMIPGILLNVYLGSFAGKIILDGHRQKNPAEWILFAVGLIATFAVTIYASVIVKKVLDAHGHLSEELKDSLRVNTP